MYTRYFCLICTIILFITGCGNNSAKDYSAMKKNNILDISQSSLKLISEKKIYFGHMSVGYNIIDGLKSVINNKYPNTLNIVETNNPADFSKPVFAHSKNGRNLYPKSKIDSFVKQINGNLGKHVDIAFFKMCYVDIRSDSNINEIFQYYKKVFNDLIKRHRKIKFIHFTVPLTTIRNFGLKESIKDLIKKIIGKQTKLEKSKNDNIKRWEFNELLKKEYKESIFDLAGFESLYPDESGKREVFKTDSNAYPALIPEYSNDGGHLNNLGSKIIAKRLLLYLNDIIKNSK